MRVRPPTPRYRVEEHGERLTVVMPYDYRLLPRPLWVLMAWVPFSMLFAMLGVGWVTGSFAPVLFGGLVSVFVVLVLLAGQASMLRLVEIIEIDAAARAFERRVEYWGFRSSGTRLDSAHVGSLRVETAPPADVIQAYAAAARRKAGPIAFDFGEETYRIGLWVSEGEARMVVGEVLARFPELGA